MVCFRHKRTSKSIRVQNWTSFAACLIAAIVDRWKRSGAAVDAFQAFMIYEDQPGVHNTKLASTLTARLPTLEYNFFFDNAIEDGILWEGIQYLFSIGCSELLLRRTNLRGGGVLNLPATQVAAQGSVNLGRLRLIDWNYLLYTVQ